MEESRALEAITPNHALVFGTLNHQGIIEKATAIANSIAPIVEKSKLYENIKGKKYVKAEGWTTMLAMLGIFPSTEYSKRMDRPNGEIAYEARVVLRHYSGVIVGAGEAICSNREKIRGSWEEYAIKSMAQTRAEGKAARLGFSWIMTLGGFAPTPAEEMVSEVEVVDQTPSPEKETVYKKITEKQRKRLFAIWKSAGKTDQEVREYLFDQYAIEHTSDITMDIYEAICSWAATPRQESANA